MLELTDLGKSAAISVTLPSLSDLIENQYGNQDIERAITGRLVCITIGGDVDSKPEEPEACDANVFLHNCIALVSGSEVSQQRGWVH